ncbi:MAG: hypothetical protein ACJAT2_000888 [Bacteriovoracaceae bacterium]|jgi:hypothetical protein
MKWFVTVFAMTFVLNASAYTFIGSLLENKQILDFVAQRKEEGLHLTSVLDRLANEGLSEEQRGARGHYLLKLKKVTLVDSEDGDVERKVVIKKYDVRTDFGRIQSIDEVPETPVTAEADIVVTPETEE